MYLRQCFVHLQADYCTEDEMLLFSKALLVYKVFRQTQNINDEYDNQGNNSKFFKPKQKQREG